MAVRMSRFEADRIVNHYACAHCWGHLNYFATENPKVWSVSCSTEGCPCLGFVSKKTIDIRISESYSDLRLAQHNLEPFLSWYERPYKNMTRDEIVKSLGF